MEMRFDLSGRTSLSVVRADERTAAYLRSQMDPYVPSERAGDDAGVVLERLEGGARPLVRELQNPAGDGVVTASDGRRLAVVADGRSCTIPRSNEEPARFAYEAGFPVWRIFGSAVRPALQLSMLASGAVAIHSASVEIDGGAVLIAGWSESGKTETALALMERGARFISDKWTVIGLDGKATPFPIGVGIRRWVVRYLPRLRSSLPASSRGQFAAASLAALLLRPLLRRPRSGRLGGLAREAGERLLALADRAGLAPSDIRRIYGQEGAPTRRVPLRAVALLVNVPDAIVRCEDAEAAPVATRLARSAAFERRDYFALQERCSFAFEDLAATMAEETIERERTLIERALGATRPIRVEAPFPTDPRQVATALEQQL